MSRRSISLLLLSIVSSCCASIEYSWVSKTLSGKPCMSTCVEGKCFVNHHLRPTACTLEWQEYVTSTHAGHVPVQSNSAIFQQPKRVRRALDKIFSDKYCSTTCRARYRDGHDGETRRRADAVYSIYNNVNNITNFPRRSPYRFVATTTVTNANNQQVLLPLILEARLHDVVYAPRGDEVTPEGVDNVNRMYDVMHSTDRPGIQVGHLLAYSNGGTTDLFNYAGQTNKLNTGPYKTMENQINNWMRAGYVDFKVVVVYAGTRPSEFHVKLKFYNPDGSLSSDILDMVFENK